MINKLWSWFIQAVKETLNLAWTLVGLIIATLTLLGSSRTLILAPLVLITLIVPSFLGLNEPSLFRVKPA